MPKLPYQPPTPITDVGAEDYKYKVCYTGGCGYTVVLTSNRSRRQYCNICRANRKRQAVLDYRDRLKARAVDGDVAVPKSKSGNERISWIWLCETLDANPCACGESDITALQLHDPDHVPGTPTVTQLIAKGTGFKRLKRIAKGFVTRCMNCQAKLLARQQNTQRVRWLAEKAEATAAPTAPAPKR